MNLTSTMPFVVRAGSSLFAVLVFAGCGDTEAPGPRSLESTGVVSYATQGEIPNCNPARFGEVYFVSSEDQFYYCDGRHLRELELTGAPGADGISWLVATSEAGPADCENGGVVIHVGPDANGNRVLDVVEIASTDAICDGTDGADGEDGADGGSCHVFDNGDGTKTILCDDGTSVIVSDGTDGAPGEACTVTDNMDGSKTITCPSGSVTVCETPPCGNACPSTNDGICDEPDTCPVGTDAEDCTACATDPNEVGANNDDEPSATVLPDVDFCSVGSANGVVTSSLDLDFFTFAATEALLCTAEYHAETGDPSLEVCLYAECAAGSTVVGCGAESVSRVSPEGRQGCCAAGSVNTSLDCAGTDDEASQVFISVSGATCAAYALSYTL